MVRHNNVVPNGHFHKDWQRYVKTWFEQPARKTRRRLARQRKAVAVFPRPTAGLLRPAVHCQTAKYNMKVRAGRGFTLEELKEAGIPKKLAPTIGIAVDHRRRNHCLESLQENANRLKAYKAKLVIFPRRSKKPKAGDSSAADLATASQLTTPLMPVRTPKPTVDIVTVTDEMKAVKVYQKLRIERTNKKLEGKRKKAKLEAKDEEKAKE